MKQCNETYNGKCQREVRVDDKCILHCKKNTPKNVLESKSIYLKDRNSGLLSNFYDELINYAIEQLFERTERLDGKYSKDEITDYLKSDKFDNDKYNEKYNEAFKKSIFIPSRIHFPTRDARDSFDYLKILKLFGRIHFIDCEFYTSSLDLENVECFFQDCKFHDEWTLFNCGLLKNEDNVIYQHCEFTKSVSTYLATYNHSQFDYTCKFKENLKLNSAVFKNRLFNTEQNNYLEDNKIEIIIEDCIFEHQFKLNNYDITSFECKDTIFKNKFEFINNKVKIFKVDNSNFSGLSNFYGSNFSYFKIYKSVFEDFVGFETCKFGSDEKSKDEIAQFEYVTFTNVLNFRNTQFKSGLDIEKINFKEAPNFLNSEIEPQNTNRETFRIIKHSFDKIGNNIEANKYFIKEMKKYREELSQKPFRSHIQEKIVFSLNDFFSDFGQGFLKPIVLIFVFAFLYMMILYGYEENILYKIYEPANDYIRMVVDFINNVTKNILPFGKFLKNDLEFVSLIFYIIFSTLIWQTIVSIKRYTKR